jgi:hypothetical protein
MSVEQAESANDTWQFSITDCRPSIAVIEAMAFVTNRDPLDIEPLADVVDPDALNGVLSGEDTATVSFQWEDHDVEISASGEIIISR